MLICPTTVAAPRRTRVAMATIAFAASLLAGASVHADAGARVPWQREAQAVTITRDDWGIAHVHGKTDADAVFGMVYAQAEDDFNRVETNYLNSLGRLAEAEGEQAIWSDLRQKLFIDPVELKKLYAQSPDWLKTLMNAWADGLNYYLATHPDTHPRALKHYEPWMALSFTEGSIGGDIERVSLKDLEAFYGKPGRTGGPGRHTAELGRADRLQRHRHCAQTHRRRPRTAADQPAHFLLLPLRTADDV